MTPEEFTGAWVFANMLRLWTLEECREFYAMLSRRPDFNPPSTAEELPFDPSHDCGSYCTVCEALRSRPRRTPPTGA